MLPETLITRHPHGIYAVDAEYLRQGPAAAHIIEHKGRVAFVDTGTNNSVPYLLAALERLGLAREAVDYVLLTHVHLDHAGGAGLLMRGLPNARAVLHPRGAPHMIDPAKLIAGARAVYGAAYDELYGDLVPIAAERVVSVPDGYRCDLGGRELELIHTPGHALHHYAVIDAAHSSIFSGDTFGVSYRHFDTPEGVFIAPATTPAQFDPDQLIGSIDRLLAYGPESIYLMHYSRVTGIPRLAAMLKEQIHEFVRIAHEQAAAPDPHGAIRTAMFALWVKLLRRQGCTLPEADIAQHLEIDLELNAQGLIVWLERQRKTRPAQV
jgi:glyoxylase-like metal-dependent hydrolase (beta-lactamase superfamily II)